MREGNERLIVMENVRKRGCREGKMEIRERERGEEENRVTGRC